jgi:carbon-monoxide dehydrogenase iron sulfur subunit
MQKDPITGIVSVDTDKCMGCWTSVVACPNGALTRDMVNKAVVKCDFCPGLSIPACVAGCPNSALTVVDEEKVATKV